MTTREKLIEPLLVDDIFLVSIKIKPTNNFKIYLDADGGLGIEKCIKINRALYKQIEEMKSNQTETPKFITFYQITVIL